MKTARIILISLFAFSLFAATANAKWWIFGKSEDEVSIEYLYINQIAFDETDEQITLYKQFLDNGMIDIRGKARVEKGKIGAVSISVDDQKTWQDAKLTSDGSFEFRFQPEAGKTYPLSIKVMDTLGRTNNVDETRKVIALSDKDMQAVIHGVLAGMVAAYQTEDPEGFMKYISRDFAGDELNLDYAIRRDFTLFDNIDLKVIISNIAVSGNGHIYTSLTYTRFLISSRAGQPLRDSGLTEFIFTLEGEVPKVYSMKFPLIFGLSDAENVATGTVVAPQNAQVLVVRDTGEVDSVSFEEAIAIIEGDAVDTGGNGGGGGGGLIGSSIPTPTNLIAGGQAHHFVDLEFESTIDPDAAMDVYEIVVEESGGPNGPWVEVELHPFDTFVRITTDRIAQEGVFLYYRVLVQKIDTGEKSAPSNVVMWDNR